MPMNWGSCKSIFTYAPTIYRNCHFHLRTYFIVKDILICVLPIVCVRLLVRGCLIFHSKHHVAFHLTVLAGLGVAVSGN